MLRIRSVFCLRPGKVTRLSFPEGEGVRVDTGIQEGNVVSPFYDPMIAKLIVSGCSRAEVLEKAGEALRKCKVEGIQTNLPLLKSVLESELFQQGNYDTKLIQNILK